jgi:hypothetical protein
MTIELLPRFLSFWSKFRWTLSPSKSKGANNMCTISPNPFGQVLHNRHLVLRGEISKSPKSGIICERYWLLNLDPKCGFYIGQHLKLPLTTSNANRTKNPTCLKFEIFIYYFGAHGTQNMIFSVRYTKYEWIH